MANAKRASMREGPLAALFRKTEDGETRRAERQRSPPSRRPQAPRQRAAARRRPRTHPRESGLPHPALSARRSSRAAEDAQIPSPQERLRHAFSSEIPENVMDRAARRVAS